MKRRLANVHPGEVLRHEFLLPLSVTQARLARATRLSPQLVSRLVRGRKAFTADVSIRLARAFGTSERFWLGLQADSDLEEARRALLLRR
jgi:addiction module HigA family antidote